MTDDRRRDGPSLGNDEELGHVDEGREEPTGENHDPAVGGHHRPDGESVDERNDVEQHKGADGGLVEEELHRAHLQLLAVAGNPDSVEGGSEDAREGKEDTDARGGFDVRISDGQGVVVRDHADANAGRNEGEDGLARER